MRIEFECQTNKDYVMINTLKFRLPGSDTVITVDRDETEYDITPSGKLTMVWNSCYLWAINDYNIFGCNGLHITDMDAVNEFKRLVADAGAQLELEDDAPDSDYEVNILSYSIS